MGIDIIRWRDRRALVKMHEQTRYLNQALHSTYTDASQRSAQNGNMRQERRCT